MTPEQLHQRILLHELRTILLDETRQGTVVPEGFAAMIRQDPHEKEPYLILADWLDEQGDELGELCRIQCELFEKLSVNGFVTSDQRYPELHPMYRDMTTINVFDDHNAKSLASRRWEIVSGLYPETCPWDNDGDGNCMHHPNGCPAYNLGRTTRMLTDVLRYCCLNKGKRVLVVHDNPRNASGCLWGLVEELIAESGPPADESPFAAPISIYGNTVCFRSRCISPFVSDIVDVLDTESQIQREARIEELKQEYQFDVTFTDHAVQAEELWHQLEESMDPLNLITFPEEDS